LYLFSLAEPIATEISDFGPTGRSQEAHPISMTGDTLPPCSGDGTNNVDHQHLLETHASISINGSTSKIARRYEGLPMRPIGEDMSDIKSFESTNKSAIKLNSIFFLIDIKNYSCNANDGIGEDMTDIKSFESTNKSAIESNSNFFLIDIKNYSCNANDGHDTHPLFSINKHLAPLVLNSSHYWSTQSLNNQLNHLAFSQSQVFSFNLNHQIS
jgi:hypothetical protein